MPVSRFALLFSLLAVPVFAADPAEKPLGGSFPQPTNSEKAPHAALSPADSIRQLKLPEGFKVTVFAAEPDIQQPIAFQFDSRGRLWVAEGYTYAEQAMNYDLRLKDRILVFEDTDNNGIFDTRKVFWEGAQRLTGIEIGFDGVYALTLPELVFLPDRDRNDIPDSPPVVLLDGFNHAQARHTMANGLAWGPDGWLYGRQGILGTSPVGPPGTPEAKRTSLNVGVWRYHPHTHAIERFTSGTTNPWGMDWNEFGEAFHINTVIGHLWHAIPGAHFRRMFGEDPDPNVFQLIEQHADHFHWDTKEVWSDVRTLGVTPTSSLAGGGHAHTGLMIYQGDNWPAEYRGDVFMINFHGRRLNRDHPEPSGTGVVARHRPDFAQWGDPWFRGIDLKYGPDGGVYVADWSDTGECHDHDGVHRVSGRMYKITYGQPRKPLNKDIRDLPQPDLLNLLSHSNEWYARQARLEIARRRQNQSLEKPQAEKALFSLFNSTTNPVHQVRALLALHAAGLDSQKELESWLRHTNQHVRIWALRLLTDPSQGIEFTNSTAKLLADQASSEKSAPVRLAFASVLRHIPLENRVPIARSLLGFSEDAGDHNQPMMLWYGIEPLAEKHAELLIDLFHSAKIPMVRKWIARRITKEYEKNQAILTTLLKSYLSLSSEASLDLAQGMTEGLSGRRKAEKPQGWDAFAQKAKASGDKQLQNAITNLSAFFGDGIAIESIRQIALDSKRDLTSRRQALKALIEARSPDLMQDCRTLFLVRDLATTAAAGLVLFDDPALADETINNFSRLYGYERSPVISTLISRPLWARKILNAVAAGKVRRDEITALMARQIRSYGDADLNTLVGRVWGSLRDSSQERLDQISLLKKQLGPTTLAKADLATGRTLFQKHCGSCHKMYGEGGTSGPELTGSGRENLDYLLQNMVDPSSQVPANYRLSNIAMKDGRLLTGVVILRTAATLGVQTPTERIDIDTRDVEQVRETEQSLMPEGLLQNLKPEEVRDLIGFLMKK